MQYESLVGKYLRETDPDMFREVTRIIGSRSLAKVGAYVSEVDPVGYVGMGIAALESAKDLA